MKRQRQDFHHKTALDLVRQYDVTYLEDLQVRNMVRNSHLAKSISDAGWAQFRTILACKAVWAGKRVVAGRRGSCAVHYPGLFGLWGACAQKLERAYPCLPLLWVGDGPRRERGPEHDSGRAVRFVFRLLADQLELKLSAVVG